MSVSRFGGKCTVPECGGKVYEIFTIRTSVFPTHLAHPQNCGYQCSECERIYPASLLADKEKKPAHELILYLMEREFNNYLTSGAFDLSDIAGRLEMLREVLSGMIIPETVLSSVAEYKEALRVKFGSLTMFKWNEF